MSKVKAYMQKQIEEMRAALNTFDIPLFEDEIAEDEEERLFNDYHCFVYEMLDIRNSNDMKSVTQTVAIYYYSENRDDLDERVIDIIISIKGVTGFTLAKTTKQRLQKKDTDQFVDRVIFEYNRKIVVGGNV
ncbi:hypothetical protein D1B33_07465 [Lysinibacillus yapensis]|uniref:DUF3168 domain-containing protein n=1 Tax=Ureibacillus yapensis TaxID=2304605 RepID=A0A396SC90_9BACL|nr:hypothetical protein [Lysinibacillus yapensis]RHW38703.1 hypothetical protein D1B33_07465 [Lysinibacillus yapensis]